MTESNKIQPEIKHMVIMHCDGLGASVANALSDQGHKIYVIDDRMESFDSLPKNKIDSGDITPIIGDGTIKNHLARASMDNADVFMALSDIDSRNAMAGQMAKHIFKIPKVICRIDDPERQKMYNSLGLYCISARTFATQMVVEAAKA
tara:strand:+ start:193 stop:636 length:444 start_codon:yes stop_codon:yes gene_type:complete